MLKLVANGDDGSVYSLCYRFIDRQLAKMGPKEHPYPALVFTVLTYCMSIASVNSTDRDVNSPLMLAVSKIKSPDHRLEMVKLLLSYGADVHHRSKTRQTVHHCYDHRGVIGKELARVLAGDKEKSGGQGINGQVKRQRTKSWKCDEQLTKVYRNAPRI